MMMMMSVCVCLVNAFLWGQFFINRVMGRIMKMWVHGKNYGPLNNNKKKKSKEENIFLQHFVC